MKKNSTPIFKKNGNKRSEVKSLKRSPENKMFNLKYKTK